MKDKILKNWTIARALYFIMGILIVIQSFISRQWFGVAIGSYFAAMGLFAFGCARGNCFGRNCETEPKHCARAKRTQQRQHVSGLSPC
jgi:hypothetical protein